MNTTKINSVADFAELYKSFYLLDSSEQLGERVELREVMSAQVLIEILNAEGVISADTVLAAALVGDPPETDTLLYFSVWNLVLIIATKRKDVGLKNKLIEAMEEENHYADPQELLAILNNRATAWALRPIEAQGFDEKLFELAENCVVDSLKEEYQITWGGTTYQIDGDNNGFWIPSTC